MFQAVTCDPLNVGNILMAQLYGNGTMFGTLVNVTCNDLQPGGPLRMLNGETETQVVCTQEAEWSKQVHELHCEGTNMVTATCKPSLDYKYTSCLCSTIRLLLSALVCYSMKLCKQAYVYTTVGLRPKN